MPKNRNENGTGVAGESDTGYGGSFTGGVAPLILGPSSAAGPPNGGTHKMGELYVDAWCSLFLYSEWDTRHVVLHF